MHRPCHHLRMHTGGERRQASLLFLFSIAGLADHVRISPSLFLLVLIASFAGHLLDQSALCKSLELRLGDWVRQFTASWSRRKGFQNIAEFDWGLRSPSAQLPRLEPRSQALCLPESFTNWVLFCSSDPFSPLFEELLPHG
jgi:hypothetical protein